MSSKSRTQKLTYRISTNGRYYPGFYGTTTGPPRLHHQSRWQLEGSLWGWETVILDIVFIGSFINSRNDLQVFFKPTGKPTGRPSPAPRIEYEILVDVGPFCTIEETEAGPCSVLSRGERNFRRAETGCPGSCPLRRDPLWMITFILNGVVENDMGHVATPGCMLVEEIHIIYVIDQHRKGILGQF